LAPISVAGKTIADFPEFAKEWDVKKNNNISPKEVKAGSNIIGWWKCKEGHLSQAQVKYRLRFQTGCKKCRKLHPRGSRGFNKPKAGKSLGYLYPHLVDEWDFEKNENITPFDIGPSVNVRFYWVCTKNAKHKWDVEARDRTRGRGCPYCIKTGQKKVLPPDSLVGKFPEIMNIWDYEKNKDIEPEKVTPHFTKLIWWKCPKGEDHIWQQKPQVIVGNFTSKKKSSLGGCPFCGGKRVSKTNSLAQLYPDVAKFWHPEKNSHTPDDVAAKSDKPVWWLCPNCGLEWETTPHAKTSHDGTGCPQCKLMFVSKTEIKLAYELKVFFDCDYGTKNWVSGKEKKWDVDILIEELNLIIEYDGAYYHHDKYELDKRKTTDLQENGFTVIRVRESDSRWEMKKITDNDIFISSNASSKDIADKLLCKIESVCKLKINGLDKYLKSDKATNRRLANEHIAKLIKDENQTTLM